MPLTQTPPHHQSQIGKPSRERASPDAAWMAGPGWLDSAPTPHNPRPKESSRNEQRRNKRMMRRQLRRRVERKRLVEAALVQAKLLPDDDAQRQAVLALDPYPLRAAAVERAIGPFEIGRVIYHLNKRRGFLSLRKTKAATDKEEQGMLAEMSDLQCRFDGRTLGQYLHAQQQAGNVGTDGAPAAGGVSPPARVPAGRRPAGAASTDAGSTTAGSTRPAPGDTASVDSAPTGPTPAGPASTGRAPVRVRNQHTRRSMLEAEFLRVWQTQQAHHPDLLDDALCFGTAGPQDAQQTRKGFKRHHDQTLLQQFGLHGLIFFQRPIYWPREMIGMCELEKGQRRCPRTDRHAQRSRMLQELNNLRYVLPGEYAERPLDDAQRALMLAELYKREKLTFDQIRKLLGLIETVKSNLERGEGGARTSIKGCEPDVRLTRALRDYVTFDDGLKDRIVRALHEAERDEAEARQTLTEHLSLTPRQADALLSVDLPNGYTRLSLRAIDKLMPHLEKGLILMGKSDTEASAMHAAGYLRRDEMARRLFDKLPSLNTIRSGELADLPNPVVRTAMYELRKVVNAIVREYGKPDAVHVEMARSLKMTRKKRREYNKKIHDRERERADIVQRLRDEGISANRDAILKYQLWEEQGERCVYSGDVISFAQLYNGKTDIDHILPYSVTLDDSRMNKVVVFRSANRDKGQRSPYDWLAGNDPQRLTEVQQRGGGLPWNKRRKLTQQEIVADDFIARQLVDTGYIARLAVQYLQMITDAAHEVQGRKGTYTAELRHQWGLESILQELPDSPAWQEKNKLRSGEKNRADHRHHTIDAIVIALTDRKRLAQLGRIREGGGMFTTGEALPEPWENFRESIVARVRSVNPSHRVRRGVRGALHEETVYGPVHERRTGDRKQGTFVVRKSVELLSMNEVPKIRDATLRELVVKRLAAHGITVGRGVEKVPPKLMQEAMAGLCMTSGVPIKKVPCSRTRRVSFRCEPAASTKSG